MEMEMEMEIKKFIHHHPLIPRVENKNDEEEAKCSACRLPISSDDTSYGCSQCNEFVIHKSCAELKEYIQHPFHKLHPLILLNNTYRFTCRACRNFCSGFIFKCSECDFEICVPCSLLVPTITYEAHSHLVTPFEMDTYVLLCNCCRKDFKSNNSCVRCVDCNFNLHKSCSELQEQIQHPFHPLHTLMLDRDMLSGECNACQHYFFGFAFRCAKCNFNLEIDCSSLKPTIKYDGHDHLLTFFEIIYGMDHLCNSCGTYCYKLVFRCVECDFNLHKACTKFPKHIQHPFHPLHPLTLGNHAAGVICHACKDWNWNDDVLFSCEECDFDLHTACTSIVPTIKIEGHEHLLAFFNKIDYGKPCNFCYTRCDKSVLRCVECDFNVHKLCTELPNQIQHPFHPLHPLTLGNHGYGSTTCLACNHPKLKDDLFFHCKDCNFNLDIGCTLLVPTFKYEGHDHPLTLLKIYKDDPFDESHDLSLTLLKINYKEEDKGPPCNFCDNPCDGFVFRCVKCDFNHHIHCTASLLPRIIKHKCHIDPLILTESVVEEGYDDFYCDACETERNPNDLVYYCEECQFVVHITCVVDEVLVALIAEQECAIGKEAAVIKPASAKLDEEIQRLGTEIEEQTKYAGKLGEEVEQETRRLKYLRKEVDAQRAQFVAQIGKLVSLTAKLKALKGEREQSITSTSVKLEELTLE